MTIREERVSHTLFLCMMHGISIPYTVISSVARNLFRPLFPTTPSLCRLREAPSPPFLRYGVSHFSLSGTLPFTANEKDPSASLGMTIRETCFPLFFYLALVIHPADRHFERSEKSFSSPFSTTPSLSRLWEAPPTAFPAKKIPQLRSG